MKYLHFLVLSVLFSTPALVRASDYPPGYPITHECQQQGPFEVCLINRTQGTFPRFEVHYTGNLIAQHSQSINVWVKNAKGQTYFKALLFSNFNAPSVSFNDPGASRCRARPFGSASTTPLPPLSGEYGWCHNRTQETATSEMIVWDTNPAPQAERDFVAAILASVRIEFEVAAFNEKGDWDSRAGANYFFRF